MLIKTVVVLLKYSGDNPKFGVKQKIEITKNI